MHLFNVYSGNKTYCVDQLYTNWYLRQQTDRVQSITHSSSINMRTYQCKVWLYNDHKSVEQTLSSDDNSRTYNTLCARSGQDSRHSIDRGTVPSNGKRGITTKTSWISGPKEISSNPNKPYRIVAEQIYCFKQKYHPDDCILEYNHALV